MSGIFRILSKGIVDPAILTENDTKEKIILKMINFVKFLHDICRQQEVQMNELQALFANIKQELSNFQDEQVGAP